MVDLSPYANSDDVKAVPIPLYVFTNLDDTGPGSLRDVINQVDGDPITNGPAQITFADDISGGTISLQSALPAITRDQATITGPITLDGGSLNGDGLERDGREDSVEDMTVTGFGEAGISVTDDDASVTGGQIIDNLRGIVISGGATGSTIGGTGAGDGNIISASALDGLALDNAQQTVIQGNWEGPMPHETPTLGTAPREY